MCDNVIPRKNPKISINSHNESTCYNCSGYDDAIEIGPRSNICCITNNK